MHHGFVAWGTPDPISPDRYVALSEPAPLPHEFVFREVWDLDLPNDWREMDEDSTTDLLAFAHAHGALWRPYPPVARDVVGASGARVDELWARRQQMWSFGPPINHIADMIAWLGDLQRCARHLVAEIDDDYTADIWGARGPSHSSGHGRTTIADELMGHRWFVRALDQGLRQYCDGVTTGEADSSETIDRSREVDLYGAGCIMIRSIIEADGRQTLKRCQNERCGRPFIRQLPEREKSEQSGTQRQRGRGVNYCSLKCKNAAAQRRRYQRTKAVPTHAEESTAATNGYGESEPRSGDR